MKYSLILILFFIGNYSWSQNFYVSVSGGYQAVVQPNQPKSIVIHSHHFIQLPWFMTYQDLRFEGVSNVDFNIGQTINHNFGYEVSFGYLKPLDMVIDDNFYVRTLSGDFWRFNPKIVLSVDRGKWSFNSKLGFVWSRGELNYRQTMGDQQQTVLNYLYSGGESFGFSGSLGVERKLGDRFSVFAEVKGISQSYSPTSGLMTEYTIGNQDQLEVYDLDTYEMELEFGDETEEHLWQPAGGDGSEPQKLYSRNFSLGGYGINLGVKFILWTKKKEENGTP